MVPEPVVAAPKVVLGTGRYGNRRSVGAPKAAETATIVDLEKLAAHFAKQQHPELIEVLQKIANRAIKSRVEMPGVVFSWQTVKENA